MHGPPLVAWLLVSLSAAAAAVCLVRRESGDEALTGAGMAVMAVPVSVADPWSWSAPLLAAVYAVAAARTLLPARHRPAHRLHHSVCSAAMVYMAVAMAGAGHAGHGGMAGMAAMSGTPGTSGHEGHTAGVPVLTGLFLLYFAAYALRAGTLLVAAPAPGVSPGVSPAGGVPLGPVTGPRRRAPGAAPAYAPEVTVACRVSMALGMIAMLLAM
jgi:hypothetical protein